MSLELCHLVWRRIRKEIRTCATCETGFTWINMERWKSGSNIDNCFKRFCNFEKQFSATAVLKAHFSLSAVLEIFLSQDFPPAYLLISQGRNVLYKTISYLFPQILVKHPTVVLFSPLYP